MRAEQAAACGRELVPVTAYGPFDPLASRVHHLLKGRCLEAVRAADDYEHLARLAGDLKTVAFLVQGRLYALVGLGRYAEALACGEELLALQQAAGSTVGEAKALTDVARCLVLLGRLEDGLHRLGRATWLLDQCDQNERYWSAIGSVAEAAHAAELYEIAGHALVRLATTAHSVSVGSPDLAYNVDTNHADLLLEWGLRLDQLGRRGEAAARLQRSADITGFWVREAGRREPLQETILALSLAKLGRTDEAVALVRDRVMPLRATEQYREARLAHLALGVALRTAEDFAGARREFLAADQLCGYGGKTVERLLIRHELATLAAAEEPRDERTTYFLTALRGQAERLWELRLQRVSMMRQAAHREELEADRARAEGATLQDALTGLGNRRRFDRQLALLESEPGGEPTVLLLIDVDEFKSVNDGHSHTAGDQVLREIGALLRAHCRTEDVATRYGGDEFAVFLQAPLPVAAEIAERVRQAVEQRDWNAVSPGLRVTISTGAAALAPGMTGADLLGAADRRLYEAKRAGRNQIAA